MYGHRPKEYTTLQFEHRPSGIVLRTYPGDPVLPDRRVAHQDDTSTSLGSVKSFRLVNEYSPPGPGATSTDRLISDEMDLLRLEGGQLAQTLPAVTPVPVVPVARLPVVRVPLHLEVGGLEEEVGLHREQPVLDCTYLPFGTCDTVSDHGALPLLLPVFFLFCRPRV